MMRRVTQNDRELYLAMAERFYSSDAVAHSVPRVYLERTFDELMRSEDYALCYFFRHEDKTAGYALLAKTFSQEAGGPVVWVEELWLEPEFRGLGLGGAFLRQLPQLVPAARYRLEVEPDNVRAKALYARCGFEPLGYEQMLREMQP